MFGNEIKIVKKYGDFEIIIENVAQGLTFNQPLKFIDVMTLKIMTENGMGYQIDQLKSNIISFENSEVMIQPVTDKLNDQALSVTIPTNKFISLLEMATL